MSEHCKVVLVGDSGVGKSTKLAESMSQYDIRRVRAYHDADEIKGDPKYSKYLGPTLGVEVTPMKVRTNRGLIQVTIWDIGCEPRYNGLGSGYCHKADGAIVMARDRTDEQRSRVKYWTKEVRRSADTKLPVVSMYRSNSLMSVITVLLKHIYGDPELVVYSE